MCIYGAHWVKLMTGPLNLGFNVSDVCCETNCNGIHTKFVVTSPVKAITCTFPDSVITYDLVAHYVFKCLLN